MYLKKQGFLLNTIVLKFNLIKKILLILHKITTWLYGDLLIDRLEFQSFFKIKIHKWSIK
jgi:hypothetical protein